MRIAYINTGTRTEPVKKENPTAIRAKALVALWRKSDRLKALQDNMSKINSLRERNPQFLR